jgi:hypothetical protein
VIGDKRPAEPPKRLHVPASVVHRRVCKSVGHGKAAQQPLPRVHGPLGMSGGRPHDEQNGRPCKLGAVHRSIMTCQSPMLCSPRRQSGEDMALQCQRASSGQTWRFHSCQGQGPREAEGGHREAEGASWRRCSSGLRPSRQFVWCLRRCRLGANQKACTWRLPTSCISASDPLQF